MAKILMAYRDTSSIYAASAYEAIAEVLALRGNSVCLANSEEDILKLLDETERPDVMIMSAIFDEGRETQETISVSGIKVLRELRDKREGLRTILLSAPSLMSLSKWKTETDKAQEEGIFDVHLKMPVDADTIESYFPKK